MQLETIQTRHHFGDSQIEVSNLGLGAAQIGDKEISDEDAGTLLNRALDMGITLFDTARGYGLSEERVGRHLSWRRHDFTLCTKVGYGVEGHEDWTPGCIEAGVERALRALRTDYIDIVLLHSCPKQTLDNDALIEALLRQRERGLVRVIGYSGENDELKAAARVASFGALECSVNITDQRSLEDPLPAAFGLGMGVIAKRPVANAPWRFETRPDGHYAEVYWDRSKAMNLEAIRAKWGLSWQQLALRFVLSHAQVHSCIVGTSSIDHLHDNVRIANEGPLPLELIEELRRTFKSHDQGWVGQI